MHKPQIAPSTFRRNLAGTRKGVGGVHGTHVYHTGNLSSRPFKEAVITPLFKKPPSARDEMTNYRPASDLPYLGKMIRCVLVEQLHGPFQFGFMPKFGIEMALVALDDDLCLKLDRG